MPCHYIVVRKPEHADHSNYMNGARLAERYRAAGVVYRGLDRNPWADLDDDAAKQRFPDEYGAYQVLWGYIPSHPIQFAATNDPRLALQLLEASNALTDGKNELAVIDMHSASVAPSIIEDDSAIEWLGWDVIGVGEWSMVRDGLLAHPQHFPNFADLVNEHGLLTAEVDPDEFRRAYDRAVEAGHAEELGEANICVRVGNLRDCLSP